MESQLLFQILKDDSVKVLHSICQQIWNIHQWPQDWKRSVFIPISKKSNTKECSAGQEETVRTGHGTIGWFQIRKRVHQSCILLPWLCTYMQSSLCKMLGWMKHKLESGLLGEIPITSDMQMTPPLWQKVKRN